MTLIGSLDAMRHFHIVVRFNASCRLNTRRGHYVVMRIDGHHKPLI
jgi:hypothetical protein